MSRKYKFGDKDKLYFINYAVVNWIDVFIRNEYREILLESWRFCQKEKGLEIYGWVVMTSHAHMIIGTRDRAMDKIVGEMKSFTSTRLRKAIESHPSESRREWILFMMSEVGKANGNNNDWLYSSARNFYGKKGMIELNYIV